MNRRIHALKHYMARTKRLKSSILHARDQDSSLYQIKENLARLKYSTLNPQRSLSTRRSPRAR